MPPEEMMPQPQEMSEASNPDVEQQMLELLQGEQEEDPFANLLDKVKSPGKIAVELVEKIDEDIENRSTWEGYCKNAFESLGLSVDELPELVKEGSKINDTLLFKLLYEYYSIIKTEILLSKKNLCGINGDILDPEMAPPLDEYFDYYVKSILKNYLSDFDRLILYIGFLGTAYKEITFSQDLGRIEVKVISPFDFVIDSNASSLESAEIYTKICYLTKKDIEEKVESGYYKNIKFVEQEQELSKGSKKLNEKIGIKQELSRVNKIYECYCYLKESDVFDEGSEDYLPYKVTINAAFNKIIRFERNYLPGTKERLKSFVVYRYLPSFKFYGTGIMNLVGANALASTGILRSSLDIARMSAHPSFITQKGVQFEKNSVKLGFGESMEIETGGKPLQECFQKFPLNPPPQELINLRENLITESREWLSALSSHLSENSQQPVGTTLAILENANKLNSVILESFYLSFTEELKIFYTLFAHFLPDEPVQFAPNKAISKQDCALECYLIPSSKGDLSTKAQKIMISQFLLQMAGQAPQLHNAYLIYKHLYETIGIQNIDQILIDPSSQPPPPPPVDPNQVLLQEAQVHAQKVQNDFTLKQAELEIKVKKLENDLAIALSKLEIERNKIGIP